MPYRDPEKRRAAGREATRRWYQRNKERLRPARRQKDRERYADERDSVLAARRERYANDPAFAAAVRAQNQVWCNRRRYIQNPRAQLDYYKQWRLRNLERARNYLRVSRNTRRAASATTHFTFKEWEALLVYHAGRCAYCGSTERIEADHRIPLHRGGSNAIANILPACRHCNRRKHLRTEEEFRALLQAERALVVLRGSLA